MSKNCIGIRGRKSCLAGEIYIQVVTSQGNKKKNNYKKRFISLQFTTQNEIFTAVVQSGDRGCHYTIYNDVKVFPDAIEDIG